MRHRAAQHGGVPEVRRLQVIRETSGTAQEAFILDTMDGASDVGIRPLHAALCPIRTAHKSTFLHMEWRKVRKIASRAYGVALAIAGLAGVLEFNVNVTVPLLST